jgi:hypothetical protein
LFNERGYRSVALDGSSSDAEREEAIQRLEANREERVDWIEFIFTRYVLPHQSTTITLCMVRSF